MDTMQPGTFGFDINKLCQEAHIRWLKPVEILFILKNHESLEITQKSPQKPPSGALFLFNRRVLRYFRNDGHSWRKKPNGKTIREGHERLKVGNSEALSCYYAHGDDNSSLQRRSYWMLDPAFEHIVLVHYREVVEGRYIPESILSSSNDSCTTLRYSTNVCDNQAQCFISHTAEFNDPGQNSCSPGSVESVTSQFIGGKTSQLNKMDRSESCNQLSIPELNEALRKLEEQLSLESLDIDKDGSPNEILLPVDNLNVETNDLQLLSYEMTRSQEEALQNSQNEFKQLSNGHIDDGAQYDNILNNSDSLEWSQSPFLQSHTTEADNYGGNYSLIQETDTSVLSEEISKFSSLLPDTLFENDQSQLGAPVPTESSLSLAKIHLFTIREVSPEWAFSSESTKVIVTGDFLCSPSAYTWSILFGDVEVPLEIVQNGVFRCSTPLHAAGKVKLCITSGNGQPCSELHEFGFCEKLEVTSFNDTLSQRDATKSTEELSCLVSFAQILLSGDITAPIPQESNLDPEVDPLGKLKGSKNRFEPIIGALQDGSMASKDIMYAILEELLKDKLHNLLSLKHQGGTDKDYLVSKEEQCIIHKISGLGFRWALHPILYSGVGINYRDSNGWTALHWAAYFGREEMVAALLAAGASARAVTNPNAHDPEGKTPASLAAANGHKGLAVYLSEAALTSHLFSLTTEKTENSQGSASVETDRGVDSISQRSALLNGGTEDQLSLRDSLAAVRNAAQAATRIQSAFRAYSFRKKQQKAAICQSQYNMSPAEIQGISVASKLHTSFHGFRDKFDKAALSIQKNFLCWKRRKEFLQIRKNVVKIQAHVRAHLARKKYKQLLSTVSVLEKVVLRWHRRGVGLRGFHAEQESIDEAEEDDITKALRRQKVDSATDEDLSRVLSVLNSPRAQKQYRRMLERYQQAKAELD
ncbi:calmodulin-binding transcription activator 4-like isoform X1 [Canna indica]|uniref:Calmodulin-binding transcription activator 4-like isoform X1 n=1 Tax=Canna indica TaxID=4628 RepID=A0AAQ3KWA2_9LILI|nr:calmodulin-binding transcription activator 4-like isoform X1 [Canna indica]